jgi:Uma2 family endonuclease
MSNTTHHLVTADELLNMPSEQRFELIKGELLTMPPSPGEEHGVIAANIMVILGHYVHSNDLGRVYAAETGFQLERDPDTVLAPDFAFVKKEHLGPLSKGYRFGAPDLVVEVLSPGDRKGRVEEKTARWLAFGVSVVWLVNPKSRTIEVRTASGTNRILTEDDMLTGDDVIPGFALSVSKVFA